MKIRRRFFRSRTRLPILTTIKDIPRPRPLATVQDFVLQLPGGMNSPARLGLPAPVPIFSMPLNILARRRLRPPGRCHPERHQRRKRVHTSARLIRARTLDGAAGAVFLLAENRVVVLEANSIKAAGHPAVRSSARGTHVRRSIPRGVAATAPQPSVALRADHHQHPFRESDTS